MKSQMSHRTKIMDKFHFYLDCFWKILHWEITEIACEKFAQ